MPKAIDNKLFVYNDDEIDMARQQFENIVLYFSSKPILGDSTSNIVTNPPNTGVLLPICKDILGKESFTGIEIGTMLDKFMNTNLKPGIYPYNQDVANKEYEEMFARDIFNKPIIFGNIGWNYTGNKLTPEMAAKIVLNHTSATSHLKQFANQILAIEYRRLVAYEQAHLKVEQAYNNISNILKEVKSSISNL